MISLALKDRMTKLLYQIAFGIAPLRAAAYSRQPFVRYPYMFRPSELHALVTLLLSTKAIDGSVVEVGCNQGWTTCYLAETLKEVQIKRTYFCIDTFCGFLKDDIDFEHTHRGKQEEYADFFLINKKVWFDCSMKIAGYGNVTAYKADASKFAYESIGPISFCLVDLDLYRPVRDCLPRIYDNMSKGGIIVIDDCRNGGPWDGAYQAYMEFCKEMKFEPNILCDKLGVIRLGGVT